MIPANLVGLCLFVLVLAPGWLWERVAERRQIRPERSTLLEAAEFAVTGVIFTGIAVMVVVGVGTELGWLPDLHVVSTAGATYIRDEPYQSAVTVAAVLTLSLAGAYGIARFAYRGYEPSLVPAGSVWRDVFAEGGESRPIFVSATLIDGRIFDGYLYSYSTDPDSGDHDLALQAPIFVWSGDPPQRMRAPADRVLVRGDQMVAMWVRYDWDRAKTRTVRRWPPGRRKPLSTPRC